jgi:hypothetical protein
MGYFVNDLLDDGWEGTSFNAEGGKLVSAALCFVP